MNDDKSAMDEIRTTTRFKIIRNVRGKDDRYKKPIQDIKPETSRVDHELEFARDHNISPNDIKKTSLYYWMSAKMCTSWTYKIDKSKREHSNIQDRHQSKSKQYQTAEDYENNVHNEYDKSKAKPNNKLSGLIEENKLHKSAIDTEPNSNQNSPKYRTNTKLKTKFTLIKSENKCTSYIASALDLKPIQFILDPEDRDSARVTETGGRLM